MITILGDDKEKSLKYITNETIKKCSRQVVDIVKNGSMVIILPNTIANIIDKYGYESDNHIEILNNMDSVCRNANIILNFDKNAHNTILRDIAGWVFTKQYDSSIIKNNNVQIIKDNNIELNLSDYIFIGEYKDINDYNNAKNRLNYIFTNNLFRFNPFILKDSDFNNPVEIIGYYKNINSKKHIIHMNVSKINYKSIIQLINIAL